MATQWLDTFVACYTARAAFRPTPLGIRQMEERRSFTAKDIGRHTAQRRRVGYLLEIAAASLLAFLTIYFVS